MTWMWTAALSLLVLLCGCAPTAREPDQLALVRVLGVEGAGPVTLTAVCGRDREETQPLRGTGGGEDFGAALERVPWSGSRELSLTSVSYLVVGQGVELEEVLRQVLEDEELGATATVWMSTDAPSELLAGCEDPEGGLTLLTHQGVEAPTVVEALAALTTRGQVELPQLDQRDGRLVQKGHWTWGGRT